MLSGRALKRCLRANNLNTRVARCAQYRNISETVFNGGNTAYMEQMHRHWVNDPQSVHVSWQAFFSTGQFQLPGGSASQVAATAEPSTADTEVVKLDRLVSSFQRYGHLKAKLDPLGLSDAGAVRHYGAAGLYQGLEPSHFGWSDADVENKKIFIGNNFDMLDSVPPIVHHLTKDGYISLKELLNKLNEVYCGSIGYEIGHIREHERTAWLLNLIELEQKPFSAQECHEILDRLTYADHFEQFLAIKFPAQKRFGLDGAESLIPCIKSLIDTSASLGVGDFVIGMPHRGRLNILANVVRKNLAQILNEFSGLAEAQADEGSGDVKYHMGTSHDRTIGGRTVHLSLMANPSHLEAVNPLVLGKTRAKMFYNNDPTGEKTAALIIHGDASFSGQGVVYECLSFSDLPAYQTGGCIHIVCNNQIGFTTDTVNARSTPYCTDVAKSIGAPIFHVNGDDPEAVVRVAKIAAMYRQQFRQDVVIDLICYRKFGHNEGDEPMFTQPVMYKQIKKQPGVWQQYKNKCIEKGLLAEDTITEISERVKSIQTTAFEASQSFKLEEGEGWLDGAWEGFKARHMPSQIEPTSCKEEDFNAVAKAVISLPKDFNIHPRIKKIWAEKADMFEGKREIDWGTAEQLAFGTLLREGVHVRMSGQDVERGTFSHRHAVLHEQKNADVKNRPTYMPLTHIEGAKAEFVIHNSNLSEYGVCGFELGYSLENPNSLVLWEAQFGDFANGAQIIFDQFLSSCESKWLRQCGLVVLMPHGYEGGGPEHSSCRMERFLQMTDDDPSVIPEQNAHTQIQIQRCNWQFLNCSTPANYFHALRRQVKRNFRKPLLVASPKSLLKLRHCVSPKEDFLEGSTFNRVIPANELSCGAANVRRHIFCTGKIYYEIQAELETKGIDYIAVSRLEQIAPFPFDSVQQELERFPNAELMWVQEEPKNMGAWAYVQPRFYTILLRGIKRDIPVLYAGRKVNPSPATGFPKQHKAEIEEYMERATTL